LPSSTHPLFAELPGALRLTGWRVLSAFDVPTLPAEARTLVVGSGVLSANTWRNRLAELQELGALVHAGAAELVVSPAFDWDGEAERRGLTHARRQLLQRVKTERLNRVGAVESRAWISPAEAAELRRSIEDRTARNLAAVGPVAKPVEAEPTGHIESQSAVLLRPEPTAAQGASQRPLAAFPAAPRCVCCGSFAASIDEATCLPWHQHCTMPEWIARLHERRGIAVPAERIRGRSRVVDSFGDPWDDYPPAPAAVSEPAVEEVFLCAA
jgi:hypothetical protein